MLGHFFEEAGLPTTQISLIRRHTEITKPPRALWVSFELGRPLGAPGDPAFQKRVLLAALRLFEAAGGPVLEDFPEDAPDSGGEATTLACPVNFAQKQGDLTPTEKLCAAFKREMVSMRPWYDIAMKKRGRTTVGASGADVETIGDILCSILEGRVPDSPRQDISLAHTVAIIAQDLMAYYGEGITAQPGQESPSSKVVADWFWGGTVAAELLLAVQDACKRSEDLMMQIVGSALIIPTSVAAARHERG
ncbi:MAG: hypothetical protein V3R87_06415 [Dehalococcoidia bacterium]